MKKYFKIDIQLQKIKPVFELPSLYLKNLVHGKCNNCRYCKLKESLLPQSKKKSNESISDENLNQQNSQAQSNSNNFNNNIDYPSDALSISSGSSFESETEYFYDANETFSNELNNQELISFYVEYDDEEEIDDENLDLTKEKSIVTHVLSQLRIGMDLESISMPSFILDKRSTLEMHAEFYSFSNLLLEIPDGRTPYERMVRLVKWYMSSFRTRLVVKKPYNPILGEVFQCIFDTDSNSTLKELVKDGPIPWANTNQLTYISEQVSHHPPITAYYLEHFDKKIQVNGYTKSKSKFLGLSVAVESIGKEVVSLIDHDEEYEFTFPIAYARSILTVPWLEMSGLVTIKCRKTGYSADINFLTKPFYGGTKHVVEGVIYSPNMTVLNTLDGIWNQNLYISTNKKKEKLYEFDSLTKFKKKVRKLDNQEANESRKVWHDVTVSLKNKQNDLANKAKHAVEQKQRDEAAFRKENNIEWNAKYFHLINNDEWVYNSLLSKRLNKN